MVADSVAEVFLSSHLEGRHLHQVSLLYSLYFLLGGSIQVEDIWLLRGVILLDTSSQVPAHWSNEEESHEETNGDRFRCSLEEEGADSAEEHGGVEVVVNLRPIVVSVLITSEIVKDESVGETNGTASKHVRRKNLPHKSKNFA